MQTKFLAIFLLVQCYHLEEVWAQTAGAVGVPPKHRIVGGRDASIQDFPFQLSMRRNTVHICGASVLDSVWALTAAHCVDGFEHMPHVFTLRIGSTSRLSGGSVISVTDIYSHPAYNSDNMNYDVALLRVELNKLRGDFVEPINLPAVEQSITDDVAAIVSGWGHMNSEENVLSSVLKYTTVYTVNQQKCHNNLRDHGGITAAMFCAAARNTDACQGDSGGPIQTNGTLIGVVSWGVGCADPYYPGVYTRLAYAPIRSWLRLISKL